MGYQKDWFQEQNKKHTEERQKKQVRYIRHIVMVYYYDTIHCFYASSTKYCTNAIPVMFSDGKNEAS